MNTENNTKVVGDQDLFWRNENFVMRKIADEFLLIPITQIGADVQKVYRMNHSAAEIWQYLEKPISLHHILSKLGDIYNVHEGSLYSEVLETLDFMVKRGFCHSQVGG